MRLMCLTDDRGIILPNGNRWVWSLLTEFSSCFMRFVRRKEDGNMEKHENVDQKEETRVTSFPFISVAILRCKYSVCISSTYSNFNQIFSTLGIFVTTRVLSVSRVVKCMDRFYNLFGWIFMTSNSSNRMLIFCIWNFWNVEFTNLDQILDLINLHDVIYLSDVISSLWTRVSLLT